MNTLSKLKKLRELMKKNHISAYIIPSEDAHQNEYAANSEKRRQYISSFTGSFGTAVVTENSALLWTDGRYFLQAKNELDGQYWKLMKMRTSDPSLISWLSEKHPVNDQNEGNEVKVQQLEPNSTIGIDPFHLSVETFKDLESSISKGPFHHKLKSVLPNLVDEIWENRPSKPNGKIIVLEEKYSGESTKSKIEKMRKAMKEHDCRHLILTTLDEIAWLLNLRGSDIPFNPVFFSYMILSQENATLFVEEDKFTEGVKDHLKNAGVTVSDYSNFLEQVPKVNLDADNKKNRIWIDGSTCNYAVYELLKEEYIFESVSPVKTAKSIKNDIELDGFRKCHIRDGVALLRLLTWIKDTLENDANSEELTEVGVSNKLESIKKKHDDLFISPSFATIAGSGPNGAIIHYHPEEGKCGRITCKDLFLLDSGSQYKDGTTDTTRTVHFGVPSETEIDCFTRVLKGFINLNVTIFPKGVTGYKLDVLARQALWQVGLEYAHGTGHGVGHFLNVHEGPHGIGMRKTTDDFPLLPGMTVTNEPGYYEDGKFGIRIENILIVKQKFQVKHKEFLGFENVTCVPIQPNLINTSLLTISEINWINNYNQWCYEMLYPHVKDEPKVLQYLKENTKEIS